MPFVKKTDLVEEKDLTISGITGRRMKKGEVGIEIEVEASRAGSLPRDKLGPWYFDRDGSLRGADSGEYILQKPIDFDTVPEAVKTLWTAFDTHKTKLVDSNRTSVHVHLNALPFYQNRLVSLIGLWYIFEEILTAWCGDDRQGNLFCLRAKDGPAIVTSIKHYIESKGTAPLSVNTHHYAAMNISSLWEMGSVEFRTLRGVTTPEPVMDWVRILRKLYDASARYTDPRTLIEAFSVDGPMDFLRNTFAEEAETIMKGVELDADALRTSMYEGMRYAQDVIYARDWNSFKPTEVPVDPFGRRKEPPRPEGLEIEFEPDLDTVLPDGGARRTIAGQMINFNDAWFAANNAEPGRIIPDRPPARPALVRARTTRNPFDLP